MLIEMSKKLFFNFHHVNYMTAFDWIKLLHFVDVWSSPNSSPLFAIVFRGETNRSSLSQMFFKIGVFKSFANFIEKHQSPTLVLSCEICENFKKLFSRTPPVAAPEQTQVISAVHCVVKWCSDDLAQVYLSYTVSY